MAQVDVLEPGGRWPGGTYREIAILPLTDREVSRVFDTDLVRGIEEGLGAWQAVGFRLPGGGVAELICYPAMPAPSGYILRVDLGASIEPALSEVLSLFGLRRDSLPWVADKDSRP